MRTDSFSKDKHLPVRRFIADESKMATGLYGPCAIADDLDNIFNMFDPDATFLDGSEHGGIGEKNLQNGAVTYNKLAEDVKEKFQGIATENQLSLLRTNFFEKADTKADKANTLSGYGITDAYTKEETDGFLKKVSETVAEKTEETVLFEDVVNTPEWKNQPTYEGTLDSAFNTTDFYYVTLKDADGNALPDGQFMLKSSFETSATIYSTVFTLSNLNIGTSTIAENHPVEFTAIDETVKLRDAGVALITQNIADWSLDDGIGMLKITVHGEFIQKNTSCYFFPQFTTDKNVASYHSVDGSTALQSDSTKQIIPYVAMGGTHFKSNRIFDCCELERNGAGYFSLKRFSVIKHSSTRVKFQQTIGYGNTLGNNTDVNNIVFRVNNSGSLRNGTAIRITEVK